MSHRRRGWKATTKHKMFTCRTAFLIFLVLFQVAKCSLGQTNVTQTPPPPPEDVQCACTVCDEGRCNTTVGCFSSLKPDNEKPAGYINEKGCIKNDVHYNTICDNVHRPVYCCSGENMCNWNVTPSVPPTQPGQVSNVTKTSPPSSHPDMECACTGCGWGRCKSTVGCFTLLKPNDEETGHDIVKGCIHEMNYKITCENSYHPIYCCVENMCNWNATPSLPTTEPAPTSPSKTGKAGESTNFILLSVFAPVAALIVSIVVVCLVYQMLQRRQLKHGNYPNLRYVRHSATLHENGCCAVKKCGKCSASSGFSKFAQRTAAQDLDLIQVIGEGRYGKLWRGFWHGDDVVAKLFIPSEEKSFKNEVDVNNKVGNHENILRVQHCHTAFSWNKVTYRCIVMEFHENGSLYDFLNHRPVSIEEMCSLALSAARGLNHLHGEIYGRKEKYSIAHCDIKSKNIMVKSNLTCAIGGLGLAVVHDRSQDKIISEDKRRGTARYMAPEVLSGMVSKSFESYKRADVYSFGLVLWEITRRTLTEGIRPEQYELPYFDLVPANPSYDEMKKIVSEQEKRPLVPNKWTENSALEVMGKLIKDCWKQNASARLPSLRVKKTLSKLMDTVKPPPTNISLSEELSAGFQDVNIHIPETFDTVKV